MGGKYIQVIRNITSLLMDSRPTDAFLLSINCLLQENDLDTHLLCRILYCLLSLYLIDEITPQPTERHNFVDMGSYYYRSESYSMDFPKVLHRIFKIPISHLDRTYSLFFSNREYLRNYLCLEPTGAIGDVSFIYTSNSNLKIPCSRQKFLIELFKVSPFSFYKFFKMKYKSNSISSSLVKYRLSSNYTDFLYKRIGEITEENHDNNLKVLLKSNECYLLTSSGTAANFLVDKFLSKKGSKNFFHKYWYYENLTEAKPFYFSKTRKQIFKYKNFFFNIDPTNFFDLEEPSYFENIRESIKNLLLDLSKSKKEFNLVLDITSDPFFELTNVPSNINLFKTISLSKYQEGINSNFLGLIITDRKHKAELMSMAKFFGLSLEGEDKHFAYIPQMTEFIERNKKIRNLCTNINLKYRGWYSYPVGLSYVLLPDGEQIQAHIRKFALQKKFNDRQFTWRIRNGINRLIKQQKLQNFLYGDSFLFPSSRIVLQGPEINLKKYVINPLQNNFKYRLPRISPGYNTGEDINDYMALNKSIVDLIIQTYKDI